jgi:predicted nucleic acid-binding protein
MAKNQITGIIVCDTNVFINLLRNDNPTITAIEKIGFQNIVMPVITALELYKGSANKSELKIYI